MSSYGLLGVLMCFYGFPRVSMGIYGFVRVFYMSLWTFGVIYEFQCVSLGLYMLLQDPMCFFVLLWVSNGF